MSTLAATNIKHASSPTTNLALDTAGNATVGNALIMGSGSFLRNRIINGDMRIDQRNAGAALTGVTTSASYPVDRFYYFAGSGATVTLQQSTTAPAGFKNSLYATVTSTGSPSYGFIQQSIEGYDVADLMQGTSSAQSFTVSFWVRSSQTGTYTVSIQTSTYDYSYNATYTINVANTWEYKTVTIPGTANGTWYIDNRQGLNVRFALCPNAAAANTWVSGSYNGASTNVNWYASSGATFYITGVQLEAGSTATPFERRQYGHELALCQRFYEKSYELGTVPGTAIGNNSAGSIAWYIGNGSGADNGATFPFQVTKRAVPTVTVYSSATGAAGYWNNGTDRAVSITTIGTRGAFIYGAGNNNYFAWTANAEL